MENEEESLLSDRDFIQRALDRFKLIHRETVGAKERDFRYSLAQHLFGYLLGWTRQRGKGHFSIAEVKDITLLDEENFPIAVIETKSPDVDLTPEHRAQLRRYLEMGASPFGILTNLHRLVLYEYSIKTGLKRIVDLNVDAIIRKSITKLSSTERTQILSLRRLERRRFVRLEDPTYFERRYHEIPILREKEEGVNLLTGSLGKIIINLTDVMKRFFEAYRKRSSHHSKEFLDRAFADWLKVSGKERDWEEERQRTELIGDFCRETAYVVIGRILFTRICEDKDVVPSKFISGKTLADFLRQIF